MALFWEFFSFELKFRLKSLSTYVYFGMWFLLSFLAIAAEDFINTGNGKQLLKRAVLDHGSLLLLLAVRGYRHRGDLRHIGAARLPARYLPDHLHQAHHQVRVSRRTLGRLVRQPCVFAFSGLVFGEALGTLAPWADHTRIASGHSWWYWQPFLSIVVVQIFFLGSLFFLVAALSRKIFIVYVQGRGGAGGVFHAHPPRSARHDHWSISGQESSTPSACSFRT